MKHHVLIENDNEISWLGNQRFWPIWANFNEIINISLNWDQRKSCFLILNDANGKSMDELKFIDAS